MGYSWKLDEGVLKFTRKIKLRKARKKNLTFEEEEDLNYQILKEIIKWLK